MRGRCALAGACVRRLQLRWCPRWSMLDGNHDWYEPAAADLFDVPLEAVSPRPTTGGWDLGLRARPVVRTMIKADLALRRGRRGACSPRPSATR